MSSRTLKFCAITAVASLAVVGCGVTGAQQDNQDSDAPFYEGKEITLIVPFDAGGASDVFSRTFASHLSKAIEGEPEIVIENVPGGATKEGINRFDRMESNGLYLGMGISSLILATQFDSKGIQFDIDDYETLVSFGESTVIYGSVDAGITSLESLVEGDEKIFYGGMELNATEAMRLQALDAMGIPNFEPLMGYDGGGSLTAAVLRGELSLTYSTASHYASNVLPLVEEGSITPLMSQGFVVEGEVVRDPAFPELPTMLEAYEDLSGKSAEGIGWDSYRALVETHTGMMRTFWAHGDAPEESRAALREAVEHVAADEDFMQEVTQLLGVEPPVLVGEQAEAGMDATKNLSPEIVEWVQNYVDEGNS